MAAEVSAMQPKPRARATTGRATREVAVLRALSDPTRIQILLELADRAKTVKAVATGLGVGPTKLYYHFKILERAGLIRVSRRRMVSGIEERTYAATSRAGWTPGPDGASSLVESGVVAALLDVVRAEAELAFRADTGVPIGEAGSAVPVMLFTRLALTRSEMGRLQRRIDDLSQKYVEAGTPAPPKHVYHAFFTVYGAPSEIARIRDDEEGTS
jgi:DNA-binding transcriptional ArsR family regulator